MPYTVTPLGFTGALKLLRDSALGGTADNNLNDGPGTVYFVFVDNSATAAVTYLKGYNVFAPTIGTTDPDLILMIPTSARKTTIFVTGNLFSTALSLAAVTTAGTAGTTSPSGSTIVDIGVA